MVLRKKDPIKDEVNLVPARNVRVYLRSKEEKSSGWLYGGRTSLKVIC